MEQIGRPLVWIGLAIAAFGGLLWLGASQPWLRVGRLPGDIVIRRPMATVYIPLATSVLLSVLLSLALAAAFWALRFFRR